MAKGRGAWRQHIGLTAVAAVLVGAAACSNAKTSTAVKVEQPRKAPVGEPSADAAFDTVRGINFIAVHDAAPGAKVALVKPDGTEVAQDVTDRFGSKIFYDLKSGDTFRVRVDDGTGVQGTKDLTVRRLDDAPPQSFYEELPAMKAGYQYLKTRDGTTLAVTVRPPLGKTLDQGPFPTVINMSGYADADPSGLGPPMSSIASAIGFATVSVNERGTGCSGGVTQLFDPTWAADGYDVVEAVAAQKWSSKVGLVGISFPGITQWFTAATQPPHLAAINPISTLTDVYRSPGYLGGIFNIGFAQTWLQDRQNDARPAPEFGQGYAVEKVKAGDKECTANQKLRLQTRDVLAIVEDNPYRNPDLIDVRSPINFVAKDKVPTLMMHAWQDEQVGSDAVNLIDNLPKRADVKVALTNGTHSSPLDPTGLMQVVAFLDIYVADKVPDYSALPVVAPILYGETLDHPASLPTFPKNPYAGMTTVQQARQYWEAQPRIQAVFDSGGDPAKPGVPSVGHTAGFDQYPPKEAKVQRWYMGDGGRFVTQPPDAVKDDTKEGFDSYFPTSTARPMQTIPGQGQSESWQILPEYDWRPLPARTAVAYESPVLDHDTTIFGSASADLWLRLNRPDTDVQVTMSEVRPDGTEVYVQSGFLRASHRHLDRTKSTETRPWPTHLKKDAAPMPLGEFELVRVATDPIGYTFRKGTRVRVSVEAVGGDRTRWSFDTPFSYPDQIVDVGRSGDHASSVALPLLDSVDAPDAFPKCPGLRGQPCRNYVAAVNGG